MKAYKRPNFVEIFNWKTNEGRLILFMQNTFIFETPQYTFRCHFSAHYTGLKHFATSTECKGIDVFGKHHFSFQHNFALLRSRTALLALRSFFLRFCWVWIFPGYWFHYDDNVNDASQRVVKIYVCGTSSWTLAFYSAWKFCKPLQT